MTWVVLVHSPNQEISPHFLRQIQSFPDSPGRGRLAENRRQICFSNFLTLMDKLLEEVGRTGSRVTFAKHLQ